MFLGFPKHENEKEKEKLSMMVVCINDMQRKIFVSMIENLSSTLWKCWIYRAKETLKMLKVSTFSDGIPIGWNSISEMQKTKRENELKI